VSFAAHLARLDVARLTQLLEQRPDVLVEPVPRTLTELALRLNGVDSLSRALPSMNRDEVIVAQLIAMLGDLEPAACAERLRTSEVDIRQVVDGLGSRGLAWEVDGRIGIPERLAEHLADGLGGFRPLALIAKQANADALRTAVAGLGVDPVGLRKPELIARLGELLTDPETVARAVRGLPPAARRHLALLERGDIFFGGFGREDAPRAALARAGLLINGPYHQSELPREVVAALRLGEMPAPIGQPELPAAADAADDGRVGAEGALLALTTLLDEARHRPIAALKKGGVGARERARLAKRLGLTEPALWIDIAAAAGLLERASGGYGPTDGYDGWREDDTGARWARVVIAWFDLAPAPTSRETEDGEVAPPLPLETHAGMLRRALLRAAADGRSLRAAARHIDWYCPLHHYDNAGLARKVEAALGEGALLGVVAGDRLTALGEHLVAVAGRRDDVGELASRCADLLPAARGLLVLQSDLTAVVSGQPSAAAARLLAAAASPETRGTATTWRFSPASVRGALDAGWTADELRAELVAISERELPQPLDYLISDVTRRHGTVRVRQVRACVTGAEADITEMLHTRSLQSLGLRKLAPTVLAASAGVDELLSRLRAAGFAPMPEDDDGVVIVPERAAPSARRARRKHTSPARSRIAAADLAARLLADEQLVLASPMQDELANLASSLDVAEVALLADALEHGRDVRIVYRNRNGNRSVRDIRPHELYGPWLHAWCHLRSAEREFTVSGIESVSPVG
jgi:XPB/Ssl2-like helicase family protein/WYL domain-containing protein